METRGIGDYCAMGQARERPPMWTRRYSTATFRALTEERGVSSEEQLVNNKLLHLQRRTSK
jgi:hypothetical protein